MTHLCKTVVSTKFHCHICRLHHWMNRLHSQASTIQQPNLKRKVLYNYFYIWLCSVSILPVAVPSLLIWRFLVLERNPLVKFHVTSVTGHPLEPPAVVIQIDICNKAQITRNSHYIHTWVSRVKWYTSWKSTPLTIGIACYVQIIVHISITTLTRKQRVRTSQNGITFFWNNW